MICGRFFMGVKSKGTPMSRTHISPISGPNALHPDRMTVEERRAELCSLLALALVRLHRRESRQYTDIYGESSLHNSACPSVHAVSIRKEAT
jgi:hypothetical protein